MSIRKQDSNRFIVQASLDNKKDMKRAVHQYGELPFLAFWRVGRWGAEVGPEPVGVSHWVCKVGRKVLKSSVRRWSLRG